MVVDTAWFVDSERMKGISKPISSPSRAEKFAPPLMRFLRNNAGSRSRGRSNSSPMFRMRSKKDAAPVIEPSSPKVTCFGQVKVRTSSSKTTASPRPSSGFSATANRPCRWLNRTLFCHNIISTKFHRPTRPFREMGLCCSSGFCKKVDKTEDSCRVDYSNQGSRRNHDRKIVMNYKNVEAQVQEKERDFLDSEPPKNALLLTRCHSAPYRSSSLACQFWGSPLASTETEYDTKIEEKSLHELQKPSCENVMLDLRRNQESENPVNNVQDSKEDARGQVVVHPLLFTRCKSVPARTGGRLNTDVNLWRQRRLGVTGLFITQFNRN